MNILDFEVERIDVFKTLVRNLKQKISSCTFIFIKETEKDTGRIHICQLSNDATMILKINLNSDNFESFYCKNPKLQITIDLTNFDKFLLKTKDTVRMFITEDNPKVFCIKCKNISSKMYLQDTIHSIQDALPAVEFDNVLTLNSNFNKILCDLSGYAFATCLKVVDNDIVLETKQNLVKSEKFKTSISDGSSYFGPNQNYGKYPVTNLMYASRCGKQSLEYKMYLKKDFPLVFCYNVGTLGKFYLFVKAVEKTKIDTDTESKAEKAIRKAQIETFISQGRFIRAYELTKKDSQKETLIKLTVFNLENPVEQLENVVNTKVIIKKSAQAVLEEALDTFENMNRTNLFSLIDCYWILTEYSNDNITWLYALTKKYIKSLLEKITNDAAIVCKILTDKVSNLFCDRTFLHSLFNKFLCMDIDFETKRTTIIDYFRFFDSIIFFDSDIWKNLRKLFTQFSKDCVVKLIITVQFILCEADVLLLISESNQMCDFFNEMVECLVAHIEIKICQISLAKMVLLGKSTYYTDSESIEILKENVSKSLMLCNFIFENSSMLSLAYFALRSKTTEISDDWIEKTLSCYKNKETAILFLEKFYKAGRISSYQKLTIENKTYFDAKCSLKITYDKIVDFDLESNCSKVFEKLREESIRYVYLTVCLNNETVTQTLDNNCRVYIQDSCPLRISFFYNPDSSPESKEPTSGMINDLAKLIKTQYDALKSINPAECMDKFAEDLYNQTFSDESAMFYQMRPLQFKNALANIFGFDFV